MQSVKPYRILRVLTKRITLLRSLTTIGVNSHTTNALRYTSACKLFSEYQKNEYSPCTVHVNRSVFRFMSSNSEDETPRVEIKDKSSVDKEKIHYITVSNLPYTSVKEDLEELFSDVQIIDEPHIVRTETMNATGQAILKVPDSKNVSLCLEKNGSDLSGRTIQVCEENEEKAMAHLGKTVVKIFHIPYEWTRNDLFNYLLTIGVEKLKQVLLVPSKFDDQLNAGRCYAVFIDEEAKERAISLLHLQKKKDVKMKHLKVIETNLLSAYFDHSRVTRNIKKRKKERFSDKRQI